MKRRLNYLKYVVVVLLTACSTAQEVAKSTVTGENYMVQGQYAEALTFFENSIREADVNGKKVTGNIYRNAGQSAYKLGDKTKAQNYFVKAAYLKSTSPEMYMMQADCYKEVDNLSNEITALENYITKYPNGSDVKLAKLRLFETCLESENWEQAEELWTSFGDAAEMDSKLMNVYLKVNIALKNDAKVDVLAAKLLKLDASNVIALEKMGEKYFWKAENRYQAETKAYDKKKTRSQYAKLLKALDIVTIDFKTSLGYFKKLYNIQPDKRYARFLGNIYARLDDKENSTYYKNRAR